MSSAPASAHAAAGRCAAPSDAAIIVPSRTGAVAAGSVLGRAARSRVRKGEAGGPGAWGAGKRGPGGRGAGICFRATLSLPDLLAPWPPGRPAPLLLMAYTPPCRTPAP